MLAQFVPYNDLNHVTKVAPTGREIKRLVDVNSGPDGDPRTGLFTPSFPSIQCVQSPITGYFDFNCRSLIRSTCHLIRAHCFDMLNWFSSPLPPPLSPLGQVYALDYDQDRSLVFFGDRDSCTVWRVPLNRVHPGEDGRELLFSGVCAWDLAFDWISGSIYWSDDR